MELPDMQQVRRRKGLGEWRRREIVLVIVLGLLSIVLWRLPFISWALYPFQLFTTFVHEISHGLAAVITGGDFRRFVVRSDLSGVAWSAGGIRWIVSSAGYVGSAAFGGLLAILAARGVSARWVLIGLGLILGLLCLLFVRNIFGVISGLALTVALVAAGARLNKLWADGLLLFLAVQLMLNGLDSLVDLLVVSTSFPGAPTDAAIMASATGIPAVVWAFLWSALTLVILWYSLRFAYRRSVATAEQPAQGRAFLDGSD
jgi:hypothetical protein